MESIVRGIEIPKLSVKVEGKSRGTSNLEHRLMGAEEEVKDIQNMIKKSWSAKTN